MTLRINRLKSNNESWLTSYADLITNLLIFFILIISASEIQTGRMQKIIASMSSGQMAEKSLPKASKEVQQALESQQLTDSVRVELTDEGLELSFDSGVTFASGSSQILAAMEGPLSHVLKVLEPYGDRYRFAVEGHTDERPMGGPHYKSNWELASARAMQVRERLERVGIDGKKIQVISHADNKKLPEEILKGLNREQILAKHRRVVVRLF